MTLITWLATGAAVLAILAALVYLVRAGNRVAEELEREIAGE